jgi:hypothetical protein
VCNPPEGAWSVFDLYSTAVEMAALKFQFRRRLGLLYYNNIKLARGKLSWPLGVVITYVYISFKSLGVG